MPEAGLAGRDNGELLSLAEQRQYEVFLTIDRGFEYEQSLAGRKTAVIIIRAKSNRLVDLLPHVRACLGALTSIKPGQLIKLRHRPKSNITSSSAAVSVPEGSPPDGPSNIAAKAHRARPSGILAPNSHR